MPLLNEGTVVSRPVVAKKIEDNVCQILDAESNETPSSLEEEWLFPIGSYVSCRNGKDGDLIAEQQILIV